MSLSESHNRIQWPYSHYLYLEKKGPFMQTAPAAWQELNKLRPAILAVAKPIHFSSLYAIEPEMIYRAGVFVTEKPQEIPAGLSYLNFQGGAYTRFELTGSYAQLPEACGRVFQIVKKENIPTRPGFYIENYVNDPQTTAEKDLITEILIPTI